jgi:hypothetical protein
VNVIFANVVFPAFFAPYAVGTLTPSIAIAALCCELVVFSAFQFRFAAWWFIIVAFLTANAVSTIIGFILFGFAYQTSRSFECGSSHLFPRIY